MSFGAIAGGAQLGSDVINQQITQETQAVRAAFLRETSEQRAEQIKAAGEDQFKAFLNRSHAANLDAQRIDQNTRQQLLEIREQGRGVVAQFQAKAASRGIDFDSGSPLEVTAQAAFIAEKTAAIKDLRASYQINSLLLRQKDLKQHAVNVRFAAQNAAHATILTGFAQAAGINASAPTDSEIFSGALAGGVAILGSFGRGSLSSSALRSNTTDFGLESGNTELLLN